MSDQKERQSTSLRAESRVNWGRKMIDGIPTDEQLSTGALMRIADKLEDGHAIRTWTVEHLINVGHTLIRQRKRQPRRDQFHFKLYAPKEKVYFAITVFGFTISIYKQ